MKTVLCVIIVVFYFVVPTLLTIAAFSQSVAKDRRRARRRITWEGMILSRASLRNYDRLTVLVEQHHNLIKEINRLIERTTADKLFSGLADEWRKIKLQKLFRRAEENAKRYNRLHQQIDFKFSQPQWAPDGEERLPRQLSILEPVCKSR